MVTKEQAMTCTQFEQVAYFRTERRIGSGCMSYQVPVDTQNPISLPAPINWRANGKCKTWKTRPDEFKLPIKHGLYQYGYITQDNAHLFNVKE